MEKISYKVEAFEGPLDLLLYLISKHKLDIYDIPIVELVDQYIAYVRSMENDDLYVASEFIEMAARLVYIKDFSIRRLPLLEVKSALEKFENEVKDSEEFKTKILEEYYCVVIENQSEK